MLEHIGMVDRAAQLRAAIVDTLTAKDSLTPDLGGSGSTMDFARAIASRVGA
jgi:isocitrate dehydrogenase (NAD+)